MIARDRKRLLTKRGSGPMRHSKSCRGVRQGVRRTCPGNRSQLPVPQCMCGRKAIGSARSGFLGFLYMRRAHFVASFSSRSILVMTQSPGGEQSQTDFGYGLRNSYLPHSTRLCVSSIASSSRLEEKINLSSFRENVNRFIRRVDVYKQKIPLWVFFSS